MNVLSLLLIVLFIFAVLGVYLFGDLTSGSVIDESYMNFSNFGNAMLILMRMLTGEDWPTIMYDTQKKDNLTLSDYLVSILYFVSFRLIGVDVMLNLFVLIII